MSTGICHAQYPSNGYRDPKVFQLHPSSGRLMLKLSNFDENEVGN